MRKPSVLFFLAVVFVLIVVADLLHWFAATGSAENFEQAMQQYLEHYPVPMRNARLLTVISILLLTAAGFIFLSIAKTSRFRRWAAVLGMVSALLLMLKIFSLM